MYLMTDYNECITKTRVWVGLIENLRHSPSSEIISVIFCNNSCRAYHNPAALSTSIVPLQILSTGLGEVRSCTLEWMNSSGKRLIAFAQLILSTFRSFQHSMSSVTVYTHLCMMYVYLEVYVHMIAHVSTRCNVCVDMRTYVALSTRF